MTPTPQGQITSTETWNGQAPEVVQEVVQEVVPVLEEAELPAEDDFDPEQV
jgi:hypothetical protein